jgi:hypothetical protein
MATDEKTVYTMILLEELTCPDKPETPEGLMKWAFVEQVF